MNQTKKVYQTPETEIFMFEQDVITSSNNYEGEIIPDNSFMYDTNNYQP